MRPATPDARDERLVEALAALLVAAWQRQHDHAAPSERADDDRDEAPPIAATEAHR